MTDRFYPLLSRWPFIKFGFYKKDYEKFLNAAKSIRG